MVIGQKKKAKEAAFLTNQLCREMSIVIQVTDVKIATFYQGEILSSY